MKAGNHGDARNHGTSHLLQKFKSLILPNCGVTFLDSQVTGAVYMIQKTFGHWPYPIDESIAQGLRCLATHGRFIVNTMGLGKTFFALFYLNILAVHGPFVAPFQPTLILAPSDVVLHQWLEAIYRFFPDLKIIVTHGHKPIESKYADLLVSALAIRKAPEDLD